MEKDKAKKAMEEKEQPGSMSSFNNRRDNREGEVEETSTGKDKSKDHMDYNGNSEATTPAQSES